MFIKAVMTLNSQKSNTLADTTAYPELDSIEEELVQRGAVFSDLISVLATQFRTTRKSGRPFLRLFI